MMDIGSLLNTKSPQTIRKETSPPQSISEPQVRRSPHGTMAPEVETMQQSALSNPSYPNPAPFTMPPYRSPSQASGGLQDVSPYYSQPAPTPTMASSRAGYDSGLSPSAAPAAPAQPQQLQSPFQSQQSLSGQPSVPESPVTKAFTCQTCSKAFARRSDLVRHERIHSGHRPHTCSYPGCNKQFIQRSALTVHERVHTGEKPHLCDKCGKPFSDSSSLARHRRIHSGKRPYKCPYADCQKTFTRKTTLNRHQHHHAGSIEDAEATRAARLAWKASSGQYGASADDEEEDEKAHLRTPPSASLPYESPNAPGPASAPAGFLQDQAGPSTAGAARKRKRTASESHPPPKRRGPSHYSPPSERSSLPSTSPQQHPSTISPHPYQSRSTYPPAPISTTQGLPAPVDPRIESSPRRGEYTHPLSPYSNPPTITETSEQASRPSTSGIPEWSAKSEKPPNTVWPPQASMP